MQTFCKGTSDYCPPAPTGPEGPRGPPGLRGTQGLVGVKGERGDVGPRGDKGERGPQGMQGIKGSKGDQGCKGNVGHDGRDGIPGEPGFDGIPGLHGQDGVPGLNGIPGLKGDPGIPGTNGTKGAKGERGRKGQAGLKGETGLTGPKGEKGSPGKPGANGVPGLNIRTFGNDTTNSTHYAPIITGVQRPKHFTIREGENLKLRCTSVGRPEPRVQWQRDNTEPITLGKWNHGTIEGEILNFTHIHRDDMGMYTCMANNGVPPVATFTYKIDVLFPPHITIFGRRLMGVNNGSYATLECDVESFPEAVFYWEGPNKQVLHNGSKYLIYNVPSGKYNMKMRLNITTMIFPGEEGEYRCYAKNELGIIHGNYTILEMKDFDTYPPDFIFGGNFGTEPPERVGEDDLCPQPPPCPQCDEAKCLDGSISIFHIAQDLKILRLSEVSGYFLPRRRKDCQLYAIGKPVYYASRDNSLYGSWMFDAEPLKAQRDHVWTTYENEKKLLYEFKNTDFLSRNKDFVIHELQHDFQGNSHVVYNGTFYYHQREGNTTWIRMYNTTSKEEIKTSLNMDKIVQGGASYTLYNNSKNYIDFSVDDNGLWAIFRLPNNDTAVMKLNAETLGVQYAWNISVNSDHFGEMFIVCGVLYAVDKVTTLNTKIRFALDLYRNRLIEMGLNFVNPFHRTTMITYNHRLEKLITWDSGTQLAYPVKYNVLNLQDT